MALVVDIGVEGAFSVQPVGRIVAVRREGDIGQQNRYECSVEMFGSRRPVRKHSLDKVWVDHHYDDGALALVRKVIEAVDDAS